MITSREAQQQAAHRPGQRRYRARFFINFSAGQCDLAAHQLLRIPLALER
jgi:hypothetical protein